jgi:parallel beta-helix repeat protein/predicted outer membrane repeat protein
MKGLSRLFFAGAPCKKQNVCITKVFCLALFCLFTFSITVSATAQAAELYVATDGSDNNGGTSWDDALATIQAAIDLAFAGDNIHVEEGTYSPGNQINVDKAVNIYGDGDDVTTVDGEGTAYHCFNVTADAKIDGFTIMGGNARLSPTNTDGGGIYIKGSFPTISNCTVSGNSGKLGGGIYMKSSSATITNCAISENSATRGGGIYDDASSAIITNCTLFDNGANTKGGGMYFWRSEPTITNCTFSKNHAIDYGGAIFSRDSHLIITNCILWGDYLIIGDEPKNGPELSSKGSTYDVTCCDIKWGFYYAGEGCIVANPLFVDAENGDLHLSDGSPCIDAGTNDAPYLPETDKDGQDRIMNDIVDMGAYEFVSDSSEE